MSDQLHDTEVRPPEVLTPTPRRPRRRGVAVVVASVIGALLAIGAIVVVGHHRVGHDNAVPTDHGASATGPRQVIAATNRRQYPTFVMRSGRWHRGSSMAFTRLRAGAATDLWDYAPVYVVRRGRVVVLGPRPELATMQSVAVTAARTVPRVEAVWGRHWARGAVILVPSTQREMSAIDGDHGNLDHIVALTSSEVSTVAGRPAPASNRITINPGNWSKVDSRGASIVLTHELTHVATAAVTGVQTPKWLSEGFADYVAFHDSGVSVHAVARELAAQVHRSGFGDELPTDRAFRGSAMHLASAYEQGWLACRYIADRYGQQRLVRFYRAVGTAHASQQRAVGLALHGVLGLTVKQFTARWRRYVNAQVA